MAFNLGLISNVTVKSIGNCPGGGFNKVLMNLRNDSNGNSILDGQINSPFDIDNNVRVSTQYVVIFLVDMFVSLSTCKFVCEEI